MTYSPYLVIAGGGNTRELVDRSNPCKEKAKTFTVNRKSLLCST